MRPSRRAIRTPDPTRRPSRPQGGETDRGTDWRTFDFHAHTYLTDGDQSATSMWWEAHRLRHRAQALTDHVGLEDPAPLLRRLRQEARAFEGTPLITLVGVEITEVPPRRIASAVRAARRAGAEIVVVHGETLAERVPPGTNRAALEINDVDVLAHPGVLRPEEAELARQHDVALELSPRRGHSLGNGRVALEALKARAPLVVDSDAHRQEDLFSFETAELVARGAGLPDSELSRVLQETPRRIVRRCGK